MQTNIIPADFAISLIPTDDNGKPVLTVNSAIPYIKAALQYLQEQRISLNTADFVGAIIQSLKLNSSELTQALYDALLYNTLIVEPGSISMLIKLGKLLRLIKPVIM